MTETIVNALGPKLQSRKWWAFVGATLIATALLVATKIPADVWGDCIIVFYGTYVAGNVWEKRQ